MASPEEVKSVPTKNLVVEKKAFVKPRGVPFFIPLLRSKYLQIELLRYLFDFRFEVCIFLRSLSKTSFEFY